MNQHNYDNSYRHDMGTGTHYTDQHYVGNRNIVKNNEHGRGPGNHHQNLGLDTSIGRNSQFPSRHKTGHSDQWSRSKNRNISYLHMPYGEVKANRNGNHSDTGQFHQKHNKGKPGHRCQYLGGGHTYGRGV